MHLWKLQIQVNGHKETTIPAIWVADGIGCCYVGFLGHHMVAHAACFNGVLAQVAKILSQDPGHCNLAEQKLHYHNHGRALATIVSCFVTIEKITTGPINGLEKKKKR